MAANQCDGLNIDMPVPDRRPVSGTYAAARAKLFRLRQRTFRREAARARDRLVAAGVTLRLVNGGLVAGPESRLTPWARGLIVRFKGELVKVLTAESGSGDSRPRRSGMRQVEPQNAVVRRQPHGTGQLQTAACGAVSGEPVRGKLLEGRGSAATAAERKSPAI